MRKFSSIVVVLRRFFIALESPFLGVKFKRVEKSGRAKKAKEKTVKTQ